MKYYKLILVGLVAFVFFETTKPEYDVVFDPKMYVVVAICVVLFLAFIVWLFLVFILYMSERGK